MESDAHLRPRQNAFSHNRLGISRDAWRTFTSPGSPYKLFGHASTGEIKVFPLGEQPPSASWVEIPRCSNEFHRSIASDFLEQIQDEELRETLSNTFTMPRWWQMYSMVIDEHNMRDRWLDYRTSRIEQHLNKVLEEANIPVFNNHCDPLPTPIVREEETVPEDPSPANIRNIVRQVLLRMSDTELRELKLPLGHVLDVIKGRY